MFKRCLQAVIIAWGPATETTYSAVVRTRQSPPSALGCRKGGGGGFVVILLQSYKACPTRPPGSLVGGRLVAGPPASRDH